MERSVIELSRYRFECCLEALEDAKIMYEAGRYKNAMNRAYYAIGRMEKAMRLFCFIRKLRFLIKQNPPGDAHFAPKENGC